jgi:hypothetical protein
MYHQEYSVMGMLMLFGMASAAVSPNICSAPLFQKRMIPSRGNIYPHNKALIQNSI